MLLIITSNIESFLLVLRSITLNDFESQNRIFSNFLRFPAATHILRVNYAEMAKDGPGQPAYHIFSIERTFLKLRSFKFKEFLVLGN